MGVTGLWQLIEPAGRPIDVKSLQGKILAVDASIWLHQLVKGFRDKDGNPLPNAHLLGVFYRVCKLLSCGIKPVFVFDGGVPILKRQTLAARRQRKVEAFDKSEMSRHKLLSNYLKQQLRGGALPEHDNAKINSNSKSPSPTKRMRNIEEVDEELQKFRERFTAQEEGMEMVLNDSESDDDDEGGRYGMDYAENFSTIASKDFEVLPLETQHEILFEMQESRKMNSWGKMEKMPTNSQDFSNFQMDRLVKRRFLQKKIQSVQQEMGQRHIHVQNLDELLSMNYDFNKDNIVGSQEKGFVLIKKGIKGESGSATPVKIEKFNDKFAGDTDSEDSSSEIEQIESTADRTSDLPQQWKSIPEMEEEEQIALAIKMSLSQETDSKKCADEEAPAIDRGNASTEKKLVEKSQLLLFPSSSVENCAKFLDTVGFPGKSIPVKSIHQDSDSNIKQRDSSLQSSESDSDFEVVENNEMSNVHSDESNEASMVRKLLQNVGPENAAVAVATIDIAQVVSEPPVDDIFFDLFESGQSVVQNSTQIDSTSVESKETSTEPDHLQKEPDEIEIDSTTSLKQLEEAVAGPSVPISLDDSKETAPGDNQKINRTLGRLPSGKKTMLTNEFMQEQAKLNSEEKRLRAEKGYHERVATSISDQIAVETQELLGLFGIPYVIADAEAESQCAFLDTACLTDGTITDDSDCWLFGSLRVYKNFYASGNRPVEFYQLSDITKKLNLDREKLVAIAMLSGGDYSEGIAGVGPVTALEILTEFTTRSGNAFDLLVEFRDWWNTVNDPSVDVPKNLSKIRDKLKKLKLSQGFPNEAVYQAYMNPAIDSSTEPFRWGPPDFEAIKTYATKRFGWDSSKCDSMLLPVLKHLKFQDKSKQQTLDNFVIATRSDPENSSKRKRGSKRLDTALKKLKKTVAPAELNLSSESSSDESFNESKLKNSSSTKTPKNSLDSGPHTSSVAKPIFQPKKTVSEIPQKVQSATTAIRNKRKAIKIFKKESV